MTRSIIAAEISYRDVTVSPVVTRTAYIASEAFVTKHTDTLSSKFFSGRLDSDVSYKITLSTRFWGAKSSVGIGSLDIDNVDGDLDAWLNYEFRDQAVVLKQHTVGASYNAATVMLNAVVERLSVTSEKQLRLVIRDPAADLAKPITTASYDNTTDAEGILKPIPFGQPELCAAVLVDESLLEYHALDTGTLLQTVEVYDQGVPVDFNPVAKGFRLVANPAGKITCTVLTAGTGTVYHLDDAVTADGGILANELNSLENPFGSGDSPTVLEMSALGELSRASASGGQWYFEVEIAELYPTPWTDGGFTLYPRNPAAVNVLVGITTQTSITNPYLPINAGEYSLALLKDGAGDDYLTYENGSNIDNGAPASALAAGDIIGVKVDFDASPMTVSFLLNNVAIGTTLTIAAGGTFFPVIQCSAWTPTDQGHNTASLYQHSSEHTYALPSGYSPWADPLTPNTDFEKLTESITDRVPGVAFDATSVTAINALAYGSPATAYTYAYYLAESTTPAQILDWAMSSIGGYWFVNRLSEIQVGQLTAAGASVLTLDDDQITGDISLVPDHAPGLSDGIGSKRNWSPYRSSEIAGSVTEIFKQQITREYQNEYRAVGVMADAYEHAIGAALPMSLLIDAGAAETEAERFAGLYAVEKKFWKVPIAFNSVDFDDLLDDIGQTITIQSNRFGLDDGLDLILVGVDGAFLKNELVLTLWGTGGTIPPNSVMQVELATIVDMDVELGTTTNMDTYL